MSDWDVIGWRYAGELERLDDESVATEFFHFVVPLWPGATHYRTPTGSFEIPRRRDSVILGFVRTPLWLVAVVLATAGLVDQRFWLLVLAALFAAGAGALTWGVGQLTPAERDRRDLLRRATGLGAPPELLPKTARQVRAEQMSDDWWEEHHDDWRTSIRGGEADELLVALADYFGDRELLRRAHKNILDALGN